MTTPVSSIATASLWMPGEKLVRPDGNDGDGANGYGYNGTLSFADTWTTDYTVTSTVNACIGCPVGDFNHADTLYTVQTSGKLAEITDSVFFRNLHADAYTDSDTYGVTVAGGSNPAKNNVVISGFADAPIVSITRGPCLLLQKVRVSFLLNQ